MSRRTRSPVGDFAEQVTLQARVKNPHTLAAVFHESLSAMTFASSSRTSCSQSSRVQSAGFLSPSTGAMCALYIERTAARPFASRWAK
ncbi:MAG: hypothetical protein ABW061_26225 [Polyangiaceae bacterium]